MTEHSDKSGRFTLDSIEAASCIYEDCRARGQSAEEAMRKAVGRLIQHEIRSGDMESMGAAAWKAIAMQNYKGSSMTKYVDELEKELEAAQAALKLAQPEERANVPCYDIDGNCPDYDKCCVSGRCQYGDTQSPQRERT